MPAEGLVPNERRKALGSGLAGGVALQRRRPGRRVEGFDERHEQVQMVRAVADAFERLRHLPRRSGYPYRGVSCLSSSLLCSSRSRTTGEWWSPPIRSICRTSLRRRAADSTAGDPVAFQVFGLKRSIELLFLRRFNALLEADDLGPDERTLLIKLLLWIPRTATGDFGAELRLVGREEEVWSRVAALSDACTPQRCAFNRAGRCYLSPRPAAEASHIIIVNHSLLLTDIANRSRILPDYDHLIIDEAHHLADEATPPAWLAHRPTRIGLSLERLWTSPDARGRPFRTFWG